MSPLNRVERVFARAAIKKQKKKKKKKIRDCGATLKRVEKGRKKMVSGDIIYGSPGVPGRRDRSRGDSSREYRAIRHAGIKFPLKIGLESS